MVNRNTVIVNRPPQTANGFEKTMNSRSPQMQECDFQEIDEDYHQTPKIYQIQNCGTVYMDSSNAHGVRMENCGNNIPQVTHHHPRIIGNETFLHSQSHTVSDGPQNETGPPTAPTEIAKSNVHLQTRALSPPQSPHPISPSHFSGDHTHHLEQLLDSSLATVVVIQFSGTGSTMADVLTPRAYNTIKALYALAALDAASSSTTPRENEILTRSTDKGDDCQCPYTSSNPSPPLPNSSLAVPSPRTLRMHGHISISVDYVVLILWAGLVAVFCVVVFF